MATRGDNGKLPPKPDGGMQNVLDALAVLGGGPGKPEKKPKKEKRRKADPWAIKDGSRRNRRRPA